MRRDEWQKIVRQTPAGACTICPLLKARQQQSQRDIDSCHGPIPRPCARIIASVQPAGRLRAIYAWHGKLYVKDGENYHQVERTKDELCDVIASYEAHIRG